MAALQRIEALLERYGAAAPRYTSYPSAVQFKPWTGPHPLEQVEGRQSVSIYIHIPFCRSLCTYCGCMMRVAHSDNVIEDYLGVLETEVSLAGKLSAGRLSAKHIHFGGGSPNLLNGSQMGRLLDIIAAHFGVEEGAEIALEADPRQMTREKASEYVQAGVNRVSLGVQDFQRQTQTAINRVQPYKLIATCTSWLRELGIKGINFDLMYGLPYQTVESVKQNVHLAAGLSPDRVAVFGYAHVPWMRPHQKVLERHPLPDNKERFLQAEAVREVLLQSGYVSVGMDHFSKPDDSLAKALKNHELYRNFQGYTTDSCKTLLGLGISSISRFSCAYTQNTTNFKSYKDTVSAGRLPIERGCAIAAEDEILGEVIEAIMCYNAVDFKDVCARHEKDVEILAPAREKLREFVDDGLVELTGNTLLVTETGKPFVRAVCTAFDAYFERKPNRHATAV